MANRAPLSGCVRRHLAQAEDCLPPGARRILQLHAWLAPTPFPVDLYVNAAEEIAPGATEQDVRKWIGSLLEYSLATSGDDDTMTVNGLVQAEFRQPARDTAQGRNHWKEVDSPPVETAETNYAAIRALVGEHAENPSWEPASLALWDLLIPHAESLRAHATRFTPSSDPAILWKLFAAYCRRSDYRAAIPPCRECLSIEEQVLGAEHPDTLRSLNNLAGLLRSQGRYDAAEPLYRRALEARERALGAEHPDALKSVNNLAGLLRIQGQYGAAESLYRRALEARERVLGAEHPDTLISMNNLAGLLRSQGAYGAAEPLYRRALRGARRVLGPSHPTTEIFTNNYAACLAVLRPMDWFRQNSGTALPY